MTQSCRDVSDGLSKQIFFKRSLHLPTPAELHVGLKLLMDKKVLFISLLFLIIPPFVLKLLSHCPSSFLLPLTFSFFPSMWKSHPRSGTVTVRCGIRACRVKVDIRIKKQGLVPPWLLTRPLSFTELFRSGDTGKIKRTHTQTGAGMGRK